MHLVLASLLLAGCAALRPVLPEVVVEVRHERARAATAEGEGARVETLTGLVSLRLPTDPSLGAVFVEVPARDHQLIPAACVSQLLCLWERRNRNLTLARLEGSP